MKIIVRPHKPGWAYLVITDNAETTAAIAGNRELSTEPEYACGGEDASLALAREFAKDYGYRLEGIWEQRQDGSLRITVVKGNDND